MGRWCSGNIFASKSKDEGSIPSRPANIFVVCLIGKFLDIVTTWVAVTLFGTGCEANPMVRWTMIHWGLSLAMVFNMAIACALLVLLYQAVCMSLKRRWLLYVTCVMLWSVVFSNLYHILRGLNVLG
jgi:hypothetical protein